MTVGALKIDEGKRGEKGRVTASQVFASQPFSALEQVRRRLGITAEEMAAYIGLPLRTYQRRAKEGRLTGAESAKVEMVSALLDLAERVLGGQHEAREWLTSPILSLGGEQPLALLDTVRGYERVKNKLLQIEYGTF